MGQKKLSVQSVPILHFEDGAWHFISIANKHYQRPTCREVEHILKHRTWDSKIYEYQLIAITQWLMGWDEKFTLRRPYKTLRTIGLTDEAIQYLSLVRTI